MAERLDGVGPLYQRALVGDAHRAQRIGHHDHQKEAGRRQAEDHRGRLYALQQVLVAVDELVDGDEDAEEGHDQQQHPHHQVDFALQRSLLAGELAGALHQLVGEAGVADLLRLIDQLAGQRIAAGQNLIAGALGRRVSFASQQRLVEVGRALHHRPVNDGLIAGAEHQQVVLHHRGRIDLLLLAIADHRGLGPGQQRDLVQRALGPHLLHCADDRVEQGDSRGEKGVARAAQQQQDQAQREEHQVEEGQQIVFGDLRVGATGFGLGHVDQTLGGPLRDLDLAEAAEGCWGSRRHV